MVEDYAITTHNLTKKFGDFTACDELSFSVKKGEIFGFLGANGAGKTTAIKMLCGLLRPTSGDATIAGLNIYTQSEKIKKNIGYMSQLFSLYNDLTVVENIRFYAGIYGLYGAEIKLRIEEMVSTLTIEKFKNKLVKELPLGLKQKLAFSVALVHKPEIIFLDEPTSGVDPITRRKFWEMIYDVSERGITVFVTTHYLDEASYCNRISIMVAGVMKACNTPMALKKQLGVNNITDVFIKLNQ